MSTEDKNTDNAGNDTIHNVMPRSFELVQVHEMNGYAEVIIRDKNNFYVYGGNLKLMTNPKSIYPPDYFNEA